MGFLLLGLSCGTFSSLVHTFFFLFIYLLTLFGFFIFIFTLKTRVLYSDKDVLFINQLCGLGYSHPALGGVLSLLLFSMAGIPPLAGFFAKYLIFLSLFHCMPVIFLLFILTLNAVSVFYYIRIIKCIFFVHKKIVLCFFEKPKVYYFFYSLLSIITFYLCSFLFFFLDLLDYSTLVAESLLLCGSYV
jgi:NADH-quinone oxidoreductase subunit N